MHPSKILILCSGSQAQRVLLPLLISVIIIGSLTEFVMTREQYLELLKKSPSFKDLDPDLQEEVRSAEGERMNRYAEILFDTDKSLLQAHKDLIARNEQLVKDFENDLKEAKKEKFKKDEVKSKAVDEEKGESLLSELENA